MTPKQMLDKWAMEYAKVVGHFPTWAELIAKAKELGVE